eukprot:4718700-Alexandrium_andersonii.AAC.1
MSASLVGSEMCIRDRWWTLVGPWSDPGWTLVGPWLNPGRTLVGPWVGPVSYTHLTLPTICSV